MIGMIQAFLNALAVSFDLPILEWIQAHMQSPIMDKLWSFITLFGEGGVFWILLALFFIVNPWDKMHKLRPAGFGMLLALIMGVIVCNVTMKPLIARIRPYDFQMREFGKEIPLVIKAQHDFSFPSGHTIACFEASVVLLIHSRRWGIPALILAFLVTFSRLYLYVHYPSDVLFSIVFGTLFAIISDIIVRKIYEKHPPYVPKHLA